MSMLGTALGVVVGGAVGAAAWFVARSRVDSCFVANNPTDSSIEEIQRTGGQCRQKHPVADAVDNVPLQWVGTGAFGSIVGGIAGHLLSAPTGK